MSPTTYKILHILGLLMAFGALGGLTIQSLVGNEDRKARKLIAIAHGIGLVIILVSGFGMMAKLQYSYAHAWVWIKVAIWVLVGGLIALIRRMPGQATLFWWALPLLGGFAAWVALMKPGL